MTDSCCYCFCCSFVSCQESRSIQESWNLDFFQNFWTEINVTWLEMDIIWRLHSKATNLSLSWWRCQLLWSLYFVWLRSRIVQKLRSTKVPIISFPQCHHWQCEILKELQEKDRKTMSDNGSTVATSATTVLFFSFYLLHIIWYFLFKFHVISCLYSNFIMQFDHCQKKFLKPKKERKLHHNFFPI